MKGQWTNVYSGDLALRSWWVDSGSECEYISIVLPEVFGVNHWIRSFSEKLAKQNVPVLALPLYGRTAPKNICEKLGLDENSIWQLCCEATLDSTKP